MPDHHNGSISRHDLDQLAALLDAKLQTREAVILNEVRTSVAQVTENCRAMAVRFDNLGKQLDQTDADLADQNRRSDSCPQRDRLSALEVRQKLLWWAVFGAGVLGGGGIAGFVMQVAQRAGH